MYHRELSCVHWEIIELPAESILRSLAVVAETAL